MSSIQFLDDGLYGKISLIIVLSLSIVKICQAIFLHSQLNSFFYFQKRSYNDFFLSSCFCAIFMSIRVALANLSVEFFRLFKCILSLNLVCALKTALTSRIGVYCALSPQLTSPQPIQLQYSYSNI